MSKNPPPKWRPLEALFNGQTAQASPYESPVKPGQRYFNRNLSWIHFNDRVLGEAGDPTVPPLERLKFLGIVSSNLDEFFMVRVAEVAKALRRGRGAKDPDGLTPSQVLAQIREHVLAQKNNQAQIFKDLSVVLHKEGIHIISDFSKPDSNLDQEIKAHLPPVKVILRTNVDRFPPLASERIHVMVRFPGEYAIMTIEDREARVMALPSKSGPLRFALAERWLAARAQKIFKHKTVLEAFPFKLIRDADLRFRPDVEETLEIQIVEAVKHRLKARVVRLEVDAPEYSEGVFMVATALGLDSAALYRFDLPLDLRVLNTIPDKKKGSGLLYHPINPLTPPKWKKVKSIFKLISDNDLLLHHPYDSFDTVVRFLQVASTDDSVKSISHTMYRTSTDSPVMEALKQAAKNGKKVTVYIEIKARFDEINNVRWANELRKAGVRVVWPFGRFKVHSKITQVIREENGEEASYLHLGTGNYHPKTAKQYTDLGLLTKNPDLGREAKMFFQAISKRSSPKNFKMIFVAPGTLHAEMLKMIRDETRAQKSGGKGYIRAKMNALVDPQIIDALYEASKAGVKIDLCVRGICCLRPKVPGLSDNINVTSVIDRFLEHSRIYYFRANGAHKVYFSSADWMPRNFFRRYEIAFPILDNLLKRYSREVILRTSIKDNFKSWTLQPDGTYKKSVPRPTEEIIRSQFEFEKLARRGYKDTLLAERQWK